MIAQTEKLTAAMLIPDALRLMGYEERLNDPCFARRFSRGMEPESYWLFRDGSLVKGLHPGIDCRLLSPGIVRLLIYNAARRGKDVPFFCSVCDWMGFGSHDIPPFAELQRPSYRRLTA